VLSVFQDSAILNDDSLARMPLRDVMSFFADDPRDMFEGDRKRIRSNLNGGGTRERMPAADFLKQICLEAAAGDRGGRLPVGSTCELLSNCL